MQFLCAYIFWHLAFVVLGREKVHFVDRITQNPSQLEHSNTYSNQKNTGSFRVGDITQHPEHPKSVWHLTGFQKGGRNLPQPTWEEAQLVCDNFPHRIQHSPAELCLSRLVHCFCLPWCSQLVSIYPETSCSIVLFSVKWEMYAVAPDNAKM